MPNKNEKLNPIHSLLKLSAIYQLVQNGLIKKSTYDYIYREFPQISKTDRVLDLGCGPAKLRPWIPSDSYMGVDFNPSHIQEAKKKYPKDHFICGNIVSHPFGEEKFDKILLMGVLHHLNNDEVREVLSTCKKLLSSSGEVITMDPLIEKGQHPIARVLARTDQGNHVRTREEYSNLVSPVFSQIQVEVRTNLLRVPYTHHLMRIKK